MTRIGSEVDSPRRKIRERRTLTLPVDDRHRGAGPGRPPAIPRRVRSPRMPDTRTEPERFDKT